MASTLSFYPVRSGRLLNYVGFGADQKRNNWISGRPLATATKLAVSFNGWDSPIVRLLKVVEACFWWGLYDRPRPLASWTDKAGGCYC